MQHIAATSIQKSTASSRSGLGRPALTSLVTKHLPRILRGPPCRSTLACTTRRAALHPARRLLGPRANCTLARLHALVACIVVWGPCCQWGVLPGRAGRRPMGLAARRGDNGWARGSGGASRPACTSGACVPCWATRVHERALGPRSASFLVGPSAAGEGQPREGRHGMVGSSGRRGGALGAQQRGPCRLQRAAGAGGGCKPASGRRQTMHPACGAPGLPIGGAAVGTARWHAGQRPARARPTGSSRRPAADARRRPVPRCRLCCAAG